MVRPAIILFIFLASVDSFRIAFLPKQVTLLFTFGATIVMLLVVVLNGIYDSGKKGFFQNFKVEILLIFLAILLSMFGARYGHMQSFKLTAWSQMDMYYYFFYFFLHTLKIRPKQLENLLFVMAFSWMFLYLAQYALYPRMLVNMRVEEARGTIRIFLPGGGFASAIFLYFLHNYFRTYRKEFLIFCLLFVAIQISKGTRSSLAIQVFIIAVYVLFSKQIQSRLAVITLMGIGAVMFFFIFQDIFINLLEVTMKQSEQEGEDIRVRAGRFFLTEFYPGKIYYLTGNGRSHMASPYGLKIWYYKSAFNYYQSDVGIISGFTKYGAVYIFSILLILRKMFIIPVQSKDLWIRYFAVLLCISLISGEPFSKSHSIVVILALAYIIDVSNYELLHERSMMLKSKKQTIN